MKLQFSKNSTHFYILNNTSAYNLFRTKLRSHYGHLSKISVTRRCCFGLSRFLCPWFSNVFVCTATHFLAIVVECKLAFCFNGKLSRDIVFFIMKSSAFS